MMEEDWRQEHFRKVEEDIEKYLCNITGVGAGSGSPSFSYSTGLSRYALPEIIICGLPMEICSTFINQLANEMMNGKELELGKRYDEYVANYDAIFIKVSEENIDKYMKVTKRHIEGEIEAFQMVWPDTDGVFPWEDGFDEKFIKMQPMLGEVPK